LKTVSRESNAGESPVTRPIGSTGLVSIYLSNFALFGAWQSVL